MATTLQELLIHLCGEINGKTANCTIRVQQLNGSNRVTGHVAVAPHITGLIIPFEVQGTIIRIVNPKGIETFLHLNGRNGGDEIIVAVNVNEKGEGHGGFEWGPKFENKQQGPVTLHNCK